MSEKLTMPRAIADCTHPGNAPKWARMAGPEQAYNQLVATGGLYPDPAQADAVALLQELHGKLTNYRPGKRGLFGRTAQAPKGLYLWGGVGRGKSLLMDLFYENAPLSPRRRVHFHEFMAETHERIAQWRAMSDSVRKRQPHLVRRAPIDDPLPHVARAAFQSAHLLCFDEFQVTDIADAMILGRFFDWLFRFGAVVVATSNRHPDDLYKDGLNRNVFLPSIDLLKAHMQVHELGAARDYRLDQLTGAKVYHHPLGRAADAAMDTAWERLTMAAQEERDELHVRGRTLLIPRAARGAARVSFTDLCASALGAEDFLTIARTYNTLFMDHIPALSPEKRNEAKRFVTLIDALYEHKTKFVCSADTSPQDLYPKGDGSFEFERTISRLMEMQSAEYLGEEHTHGEVAT
ncbi:cell division protein ZapE [Parvularcula sp. IMCC14364]|uniref:cell division protein ZapE n=1 Tax=Parvularcula sp. IMCC14364 TaxID=3067902 RepID=UPI0027422F44|nr:cell division protein ZapE [Parvularcula sp. IMCC14364]